MKPEIPLEGIDEYYAFTPWRRVTTSHRPGQIKRLQRKFWKRVSRAVNKALNKLEGI